MFEKIQKNFGFGAMRLPMVNGRVDLEQTTQMVDHFMASGFNYFDTAHMYLEGQSEPALKHCLTSRYPRESFVLTNKLSGSCFEFEEQIRPLFQSQLEACGVEYFDFYLMHSQTRRIFQKFQDCHAYEVAMELKKEGKVKHLGFSFHDGPEVLEQILTKYPEMEVVQLQFNYLDMEALNVQSRACYEVCRRHNKPVIVMEPVKGGKLAQLPPKAHEIFAGLGGGSDASYAVRYAASYEGVMMVLSGMSNLAMVQDNCGYMQDFQKLSQRELEAVAEVCRILKQQEQIECTSCRYCTEVCPQQIPIPELFGCMNKMNQGDPAYMAEYQKIIAEKGKKASQCVGCGACEKACPQHLPIRKLLRAVAEEFE